MDAYDLQARHAPAALTILPIILLLAGLIPQFQASTVLPGVAGVAALSALQVWLARLARTNGVRIEPDLYFRWGGKPCTAMLRHSDVRVNEHTKRRYHAALESICPQFRAPTPESERADYLAADALYETAVDELRRRAKARKIEAVHRENISFGFARNLLGLKPWGISIAILSFSVALAFIGNRANWQPDGITQVEAGVLVILALDIAAWILGVTENLVRAQAEGYCRALFETIEAPVT